MFFIVMASLSLLVGWLERRLPAQGGGQG